jgi:hypothetical protein
MTSALRVVHEPELPALSEAPRWRVSAVCPPDWCASVQSCGGGFFHTPTGLRFGAPPGETRFFEYTSDRSTTDGPIAIAIAAVRRCRFSLRPRHAGFATWPAVRDPADFPRALTRLRDTLREIGIAEATIESFDAEGDAESAGDDATARWEYPVHLKGDADAILQQCAPTHRRRIRRGEKAGWQFRILTGLAARDAITGVQELASERAARRGDGFDAAAPVADAWSGAQFSDPWGACTVGAFDNDRLLTAAVIGWGNGRAFYVTGGSTAHGYAEGSAAWLHWKAMSAFRQAGGEWYNLGGVGLAADTVGDPSHGLHRFKSGFGCDRSARTSARWVISPGHLRSHSAAAMISRRMSR